MATQEGRLKPVPHLTLSQRMEVSSVAQAWYDRPLHELHTLRTEKKVTTVEIAEAVLKRIEAVERKVNIPFNGYIYFDDEGKGRKHFYTSRIDDRRRELTCCSGTSTV